MVLVRQLCALMILFLFPLTGSAQTFEFDTPIAGDVVPVQIELSETAMGVQVDISIEEGSGDLLGFFANLNDETLLPSLSVLDETGVVTDVRIEANRVWKVGGGNNLNPVKGWDIGVRLGDAGSAGGALTSASFVLTSADLAGGLPASALTGADNQGFVFGVRIQSTEGPEGSSKMGLVASMAEASVEILDPLDQALLNTAVIDVSGLVSGADSVAITVIDTVEAGVADGTFVATDIVLEEGLNTITATATSPDGTVTDSIQVRVDTTAPDLLVLSPADGSTTDNPETLLSGLATDEGGLASVSVNGELVEFDEEGFFEAELALDDGANSITVVATDLAGNSTTTTLTVNLEVGGAQ